MWEALLGSVVNTGLQMWQQNEQNNFNSAEAAKQRDWAEFMSGTAYRRAVNDLKAAGLSPMLAYGKTFGPAATPGGASAQSANVGSYSQANTTGALVKATIDKIKAETDREVSATDVNSASAAKIRSETEFVPGLAQAQIGVHRSSAGHYEAQVDQIRQEMTNFENRVNNLLSDTMLKDKLGALYSEQRAKTVEEKLYVLRQHSEKMPAEIEQISALAKKLVAEAHLLRLEVPEYVKRAAFWESPAGTAKPYGEILRDLPIRRR